MSHSIQTNNVVWNSWCYVTRLINYTFYDKTRCVHVSTLADTTFYLGCNQDYPITKYCTYCGVERFTDKQIEVLEDPNTTFANIENDSDLNYIATASINPIVCESTNCVTGQYNLSNVPCYNYELDLLMTEKKLKPDVKLKDLLKLCAS